MIKVHNVFVRMATFSVGNPVCWEIFVWSIMFMIFIVPRFGLRAIPLVLVCYFLSDIMFFINAWSYYHVLFDQSTRFLFECLGSIILVPVCKLTLRVKYKSILFVMFAALILEAFIADQFFNPIVLSGSTITHLDIPVEFDILGNIIFLSLVLYAFKMKKHENHSLHTVDS